jgi:uncharacterized protein involved in exopolysaccharide biosynthesis
MNTLAPVVSLREALAIAFRDQRILLVAFLVPVVIAVVAALLTPRAYMANATLLVKTGRQFVPQSDVGQAINNLPTASMQETMNSEVSILRSRDLSLALLDRVGLEHLYPDIAGSSMPPARKQDLAIRALSGDLGVENPAQSTVINLSLQNRDPAVAATALDGLVTLYRQKHVDVFATPRADVLTGQLATELASLTSLEERAAKFRIEHDLFDAEAQRQQLIEERGQRLSAKGDLDSRNVELANKLAFLRDRLLSTPESQTVGTEKFQTESVNTANVKLLELRREEQNLLSRYLADSRPVQNVRADIAVVERFLAEQGKQFQGKVMTGSNPVFEDLRRSAVETEAALEPLAKQGAELGRQIAEIDQRLQRLEVDQRDLAAMEQAITSGRENVKALRGQLHQATVNETLDRERIDSISVVQAAASLPDPVRPRRLLWIFTGMIAGLLVAAGTLLVRLVTRNTFLTAEAVEQGLKLPVLVSLPDLGTSAQR